MNALAPNHLPPHPTPHPSLLFFVHHYQQNGEDDGAAEGEAEAESSDEEEDPADYRRGGYHPVRIGDVFKSRYRVVRKLGWGHFRLESCCRHFACVSLTF